MKLQFRGSSRVAYGSLALMLGAIVAMPALIRSASAAPVTSRFVQLGSSAPSATTVTYKVGFTVPTTGNVGGIVVDFCSNSPIIGDSSCGAPTGFNVNRSTTSLNNQTGLTGFSITTTDATNNRIIIGKATATSITSGTAVSFELGDADDGFTNPSTLGTFYARIYTYTTQTAANAHSSTAPTGYVDAGGVALSTAAQLNVTAKVQESLTFCVYTGANCGAGGTAVTLGDSNGVLASNITAYTASAKYDLASNALGGVVVRMQGDTLKAGSFSLTGHGATCVADSTTATVEQFGMRLSTIGTGQTATAPYNCASGSHGFDTSTACTTAGDENVTCAYGDRIASTAGATASSTSTMEFAAKSASTTEAGIYTSALGFIATGAY